MDVKTSIASLFKTELDRRQFLAHIGAGLLVLVGIGSLLKALSRPTRPHGYGSGDYGSKR
jgi:hypothetical protein